MGWTKRAAELVGKWFAAEHAADRETLKRGADRRSGPTSSGYGYGELSDKLKVDQDLRGRQIDYELMDDYPEGGATLDIYADDSTLVNSETGHVIWPVSDDAVVKRILEDLLWTRMKIDKRARDEIRQLAKYGDAYGEILISDKPKGVVGVNILPPATMRRVEDDITHVLVGFVQDVTSGFSFTQQQMADFMQAARAAMAEGKPNALQSAIQDSSRVEMVGFEPWEVVHWRLRGKTPNSTYGHSILESARWIFRRLVMAEDNALLYKLTRAPARFAFYVDTADLPPAKALAHMRAVKREYRKNRVLNKTTGKLDFQLNPVAGDEDLWIATRNGQDSTRVEVISGPDVQMVEDLEYYLNKWFSAVKVPPSYLGRTGETSRAALAQEDVRFARSAMRLQKEYIEGWEYVCEVHLVSLGIDPNAVRWSLMMTVPSQVFEMAQIEALNARADLAERMANWWDKETVMSRVFHHSAAEAREIIARKRAEARQDMMGDAQTQDDIAKQFPGAQQGELPPADGQPAPEESIRLGVTRALRGSVELRQLREEIDSLARRLDGHRGMVKDVRRLMKFQLRGEPKQKERGLSGVRKGSRLD